jgi:hypothetical protein
MLGYPIIGFNCFFDRSSRQPPLVSVKLPAKRFIEIQNLGKLNWAA